LISVPARFTSALRGDGNYPVAQVSLVLGNYFSNAIYGSTVSASSTDGSGNYPAAGAIDGDRTEINVGAASGADNGVGKSSWRSATAPSVTPQTLTIDMGSSRTINRIKLYHLASHGLKSYKLESSPDNSAWTLIAKTADQGGTIVTTNQLDTINFTDTVCRYVRLTIADTVVVADKANVVEIEAYRVIDVSDRVKMVQLPRKRDYKFTNPLAAGASVSFVNNDRFFSFDYVPIASEISSGFVNSELAPGVGIEIKTGFAYGGGVQDVVTNFIGLVDRMTVDPAKRLVTFTARDRTKVLINQIASSGLKTSIDIASAIQYLLNLANISNWEMSLDTTTIVLDYFFTIDESLLTSIQTLVEAAGDALFWFDENGIATFRYYLQNTPLSHTDGSSSDFASGTETNIFYGGGELQREWFLIDDFSDGEYDSNPAWLVSNGYTGSTIWYPDGNFQVNSQNHSIDFSESGGAQLHATLSNGDYIANGLCDQIKAKLEGTVGAIHTYTVNYNPITRKITITPNTGTIQIFWSSGTNNATGAYNLMGFDKTDTADSASLTSSHQAANNWSVNSNALRYTQQPNQSEAGVAKQGGVTTASGTWKFDVRLIGNTVDCYINPIAHTYIPDIGIPPFTFKPFNYEGYGIRIFKSGGTITVTLIKRSAGVATVLGTSSFTADNNYHGFRFSRDDSTGDMVVTLDGAPITANDPQQITNSGLWIVAESDSEGGSTQDFTNVQYTPNVNDASSYTGVVATFISQTIDQGASISSEGLFASAYVLPVGTSLTFETSTSPNGSTWDPWVTATPGSPIASTTRRYIRYRITFHCPIDDGLHNANITTPLVVSVTISWFGGSGSPKYPSSVSFTFTDEDILMDIQQDLSDQVGGDSSIINHAVVSAAPLVLTGNDIDIQWEGTTGTPLAPISASNKLVVTNGSTLTYRVALNSGMDTSRMSGANPASAVVTFSDGASGSWVISRINPSRPVLVITITNSGTISLLQLQGKIFNNTQFFNDQEVSDDASIEKNGERLDSVSNQYIISAAFAAIIAQRLVDNSKDAFSYISRCKVRPALNIQVGDRVTVQEKNTGLAHDYLTVGFTHTIQADLQNAQAESELNLIQIPV